MSDVLYRAYVECNLELFSEELSDYYIHYHQFKILKRTPCGVWIEYWTQKGKRFVNLTLRKRFAYETKQEALIGLEKRTQCYIKILSANLEAAEINLRAIQAQQVLEKY